MPVRWLMEAVNCRAGPAARTPPPLTVTTAGAVMMGRCASGTTVTWKLPTALSPAAVVSVQAMARVPGEPETN